MTGDPQASACALEPPSGLLRFARNDGGEARNDGGKPAMTGETRNDEGKPAMTGWYHASNKKL